MPAIAKSELHGKILAALGSAAEWASDLDEVPMRLRVRDLTTELVLYAFTLTSPPGGRQTGEHKIQLILPGQPRGARGKLTFPPGAFTIILGWSDEEQIFSLWDAYAHETFSYSQNLQVKGDAVWRAQSGITGECERRLRRGRGSERVVTCRPEYLVEGFRSRIDLSARRLSEVGSR